MTLPLALQDGSAFPTRDLAIVLAAGTIVVSLLAANLSLPYFLRGMSLPPETLDQQREDEARTAAARAAIDAIEYKLRETAASQHDPDLYLQAGTRLITQYRERIEARSSVSKDAELARRMDQIESALRVVALDAERREFYRFAHSGILPDESIRRLVREVDLLESRFRVT